MGDSATCVICKIIAKRYLYYSHSFITFWVKKINFSCRSIEGMWSRCGLLVSFDRTLWEGEFNDTTVVFSHR